MYKQLIKHRCNPRIGMWLGSIGVGLLVGSTRKKLGGLHKDRLVGGCLKDEDMCWVGEGWAYGWLEQ